MGKRRHKNVVRSEDAPYFLCWLEVNHKPAFSTIERITSYSVGGRKRYNRTTTDSLQLMARHNEHLQALYMKWVLLDRPWE